MINALTKYAKHSRKILFACLLFFSCKVELKKTLATFNNGRPSFQAIYPNKSDTTSGTLLLYYPSGKIFKEAILSNNKYVQRKVTYYEDGKIYQIDSLDSPCDTSYNTCDGSILRYYDNGYISQRYVVKNNQFNGLTQQFDKKGNIAKEYELLNDSIKNGIYREFYVNGKISFECEYKNDTVVGYSYFFDENGDTLKYYNHFNGVLSFPYKRWLGNGQILYGDYTDNSERSIRWIWLDKSGNVIKKKVISANQREFIVPN